ncbi:facilitated trehalose transporter Tret1-like isoform X2 [Arctopsyche grandis]|uniref:facilitated trehalose transporter Tret1-like isoform X2 n=1 Tax=Arctopsyche grandis TaxID=121162 RepID=UPI00406D72A6
MVTHTPLISPSKFNDTKSLVNNSTLPQITATHPERERPVKDGRGKALRQVIAAFIANLGCINTGLVFGFSAVAVPQLEDPTSFIKIDEFQASWVASLSSASTPFGCVLGGYLMDRIGRRLTLILTEIPLIFGWILIASAQNIEMIYIGRLLAGLGSGMVGAPARVYTCEVTQPHLRGMLGALASVCISFGVLLQYVLGSCLNWQILSGISSIIPVISLLSMLIMPETPNYLLNRNDVEKARFSLSRLRGSTFNVDKEIDQMVHFKQSNNVQRLTGIKDTIRALISPSTLKPFGILYLYFLIYQFSGVNTITFYAVEIFQESGTNMNKYLATIILGLVRLSFTILACIALRKCGRRPLTFISGIGCGTTMLGLGTYLYYRQYWLDNNLPMQQTWIPVACIFLYTIACTMGFLVVPWVMIGEVYPTQVRGIIGGFTTCSAHMFVFIVVKTYPFLSHSIQRYGTFWLYGCISLFGTIFFYFCLPETKGKTLQEIEDYFCGRTQTLSGKKQIGIEDTTQSVLTPLKGQLLP